MSVLIKGMAMPKEGCKDCRLVKRGQVYDICPFLKREVNGNVERGGKPYDCPLIELPDHGDLIDRDALKADLGITDWECNKCEWGGLFGCKRGDFSDACFFLENAEVVIPAERSEDGEA